MYLELSNVLEEIAKERGSQDKKWGVSDHDPLLWLAILGKQVGEANQAVIEEHFDSLDADFDNYRHELVQVAAVAVAAIECLDRKEAGEVGRG